MKFPFVMFSKQFPVETRLAASPTAERGQAPSLHKSDVSVRRHRDAHDFDHASGKLAGLHFGGARHQALEIVSYFFLLDGALQALLDQIGGFGPSEEAEHHDARKNDGAGVDDVLVGVLGSGAVRGFENGVAVADVRSRSNAKSADLRGAGVGDVVAV